MFCSDDCELTRYAPPSGTSWPYPCMYVGVISTCPTHFDNWKLKSDCESGDNSWVYYRETRPDPNIIDPGQKVSAVYKNSYCAICNMDDNITDASIERRKHYGRIPFWGQAGVLFSARVTFKFLDNSCFIGWEYAGKNARARNEWGNFTVTVSTQRYVYSLPTSFGHRNVSTGSIRVASSDICRVDVDMSFHAGRASAYGPRQYEIYSQKHYHDQTPIKQVFSFDDIFAENDDMTSITPSQGWEAITDINICANGDYKDADETTYIQMRLSNQGIEVRFF